MPGSPQENALAYVAARSCGDPVPPGARVTLNFHPDRLVRGETVLARLAADGVYRSQFETGIGNGSLSAHPGGDRWRWESRIFGGAYDGAPASTRPKYGALDHRARPCGGAVRFGSAHLRLTREALRRTTFCFPDSHLEPADFGVADRMALIAALEAAAPDLLDHYVEAQVHGPIRLSEDVEAVVLDPCFRGTEIEDAAARLPCPVEWHPGLRLSVGELRRHPGYRGPEFVELGCSLAVGGQLDAAVLGAAARTGAHDPQALKRVWHYVARFGEPV